MENLDVGGNALTNLDVEANTKLRALYCDRTRLTDLNLSNNTNLKTLICSHNLLAELDVSACTQLTMLECEYNNLTGLNLSNNYNLESLYCANNALRSLELGNTSSLHTVNCANNQLSVLDLYWHIALYNLDCSHNSLVYVDMCYPDYMDCSGNALLYLPQSYMDEVAAKPDEYTLIMDNQVAAVSVPAYYSDITFEGNYDFNAGDNILVDLSALWETECGWDILSLLSDYYTPGKDYILGTGAAASKYYWKNHDGYDYLEYAIVPAAAVQNGSLFLQLVNGGPVMELPLEFTTLKAETESNYILLSTGSTATIPYTLSPNGFIDYINNYADPNTMYLEIQVCDALGFHNLNDVSVSMNADNLVITAGEFAGEQSGAVYAVARIIDGSDNVTYFGIDLNLRVDIVDENLALAVQDVTLVTTKVTDEYFKTDRAEITVIPELEMNARVQGPGGDMRPGIQSAYFTNPDLAAIYSLSVKDDRTLVLQPEYETGYDVLQYGKKITGTYKSNICVTVVDGGYSTQYTTAAQVSVTVKTSQPKLKAAPVKLNSYLPATLDFNFWVAYESGVPLVVSGGTVTGYTALSFGSGEDIHSFAVNPEDMTLTEFNDYYNMYGKYPANESAFYIGEPGKKLSATATAWVTVEGWTELYGGWPVTVKFTAAPTAPSLKLSAKSVTLYPYPFDYAAVKVTPSAAFADQSVTISRMELTINKETYTYYGYDDGGANCLFTDGMECWLEENNGETFLRLRHGKNDDCTAKVYLSLAGKEFAVNVKLKGYNKYATSLTVKTSGAMDIALPYSLVNLQATMKNAKAGNPDLAVYVSRIYSEKKGTTPVVYYSVEDSMNSGAFEITEGKGMAASVRMMDATQLDSTRTYYAELYVASKGVGTQPDDALVFKTVKLPVKASKTQPKASVKVKTTGAINVTTGSALTASFTVKNCYGDGLLILAIYRTYYAPEKLSGEEGLSYMIIHLVDGTPVEVYQPVDSSRGIAAELKGSSVELSLQQYNEHLFAPGDKIRVDAHVYDSAFITEYAKTSFTTTLKQTKNVIKPVTPTVTISRTDRNDAVSIPLSGTGLPIYVGIAWLDAKASDYFDITMGTDDTLVLAWKDSTTPASKLPASVTAKVTLYVRDPLTGAPIFTAPQVVTLKIMIK